MKFGVPSPEHADSFATSPASWLFLKSMVMALQKRSVFEDVQSYCMFIGCRRSGSSILGAVLDAHPLMAIAHELDVLQFLDYGFSREQLFSIILDNSSRFAQFDRGWSARSHIVPNQWNGKFEKVNVIGDKKAGASTSRLMTRPDLIDKLRQTVGKPIKFIHTVRNPYDNISTICRTHRHSSVCQVHVDMYFDHVGTCARLKKTLPADELYEVRSEDFISEPTGVIRELCAFLGVSCPADYLEDAASIVFPSPNQSRFQVKWNEAMIQSVRRELAEYEFLEGYSYDEAQSAVQPEPMGDLAR